MKFLIEVFKHLDIEDLFHAFYNLNSRLNAILYSIDNLSWTVSKRNYQAFDPYKFPTQSISTLIITADIHLELNQFPSLRSLTLLEATFAQIQQINSQNCPYLEHLAISLSQSFPYSISKLIDKIFSNEFPRLQSCHLPKINIITKNNLWTQVLSLRKLKLGKMNIIDCLAVLSACPNLEFLKFIICASTEKPAISEAHMNLKKMSIVRELWSHVEQSDINRFLSYVPNLEKFSVHHAEFGANMNVYISYDWLSSSIMTYLTSLRRFDYYLDIFYFGMSNTQFIQSILDGIQGHFKQVYNDQYQSRLVVTERLS